MKSYILLSAGQNALSANNAKTPIWIISSSIDAGKGGLEHKKGQINGRNCGDCSDDSSLCSFLTDQIDWAMFCSLSNSVVLKQWRLWLLSTSSEVQDNRWPYDLDYACFWERKLTNVVISRRAAGPHSLLLLLPFPVYFLRLPHKLQTKSRLFSSCHVPSVPALCPNPDTQIFKHSLAFEYGGGLELDGPDNVRSVVQHKNSKFIPEVYLNFAIVVYK